MHLKLQNILVFLACYSIFGSAIQHNVEAVTSCYYGSTVSGSIAGFLPLTPTKTLCVGDNDACYNVSAVYPGNIAVVGYTCASTAMCSQTTVSYFGYTFTNIKINCCFTDNCNSGSSLVNGFSTNGIFLILSMIATKYLA